MRLTRVAGTFNIGVNAVANESLAFITPDADAAFIKDVEEVLGVKPFQTTVSGSHVVGSLVAMNSNGAVLSGLAEESEVEVIRKCLPVLLLPDQYNAAGNNILVNDNGAVVNPEMDDRTAEKVARSSRRPWPDVIRSDPSAGAPTRAVYAAQMQPTTRSRS